MVQAYRRLLVHVLVCGRGRIERSPPMPTVADILAVKGAQVHSTTPGATVLDATQKMNQYKLGALIVMQGTEVAGIFTERDVLRRVVAEQRDPSRTELPEAITRECVKVRPDNRPAGVRPAVAPE